MALVVTRTWTDVCAFDSLVPDRGVCALVGDYQVAVFRLSPTGDAPTEDSPEGGLYAVSNYDPFSEAFVISRGVVGSRGDTPKVASPIFKQSFDLLTGECLDDTTISIPTFEVRVLDGIVQVAVPEGPLELVTNRPPVDDTQ